jgi:hypothetical protein
MNGKCTKNIAPATRPLPEMDIVMGCTGTIQTPTTNGVRIAKTRDWHASSCFYCAWAPFCPGHVADRYGNRKETRQPLIAP